MIGNKKKILKEQMIRTQITKKQQKKNI